MAGLSLAFYMNESRILRKKKVLIIDRHAKDQNDHTWCFWEKQPTAFEEIVFRRWGKMWFHGAEAFSKLLDLGAYEYKMIRAIDFYECVLGKVKENPNFEFLQAEILSIGKAEVITSKGEFSANDFIFDSFTRLKYDNPNYHNLFQHFYGWQIETETASFNAEEATLFDFRVEQKNECRFVYILPFDQRTALIEFTVFSKKLLEKSEYEFYLRRYIKEVLEIENYKITDVETGVIPMSDQPHEQFPAAKIVRIGTSGGYVKSSTGYSFQRTQRRLRKLTEQLENSREFGTHFPIHSRWKLYLDSVLLDVLSGGAHPADDVFTRLFTKNEAAQVLKFLDEDTGFAEDLQIMRTVPVMPFTISAAKTAFKIVQTGHL